MATNEQTPTQPPAAPAARVFPQTEDGYEIVDSIEHYNKTPHEGQSTVTFNCPITHVPIRAEVTYIGQEGLGIETLFLDEGKRLPNGTRGRNTDLQIPLRHPSLAAWMPADTAPGCYVTIGYRMAPGVKDRQDRISGSSAVLVARPLNR